MKNIGMALLAAMMIASCVKKEEKPDEVNSTTTNETVEKTVVVDTVAVEKPEEKGTSVKIGSDGVNVDSKDVDVEIKK